MFPKPWTLLASLVVVEAAADNVEDEPKTKLFLGHDVVAALVEVAAVTGIDVLLAFVVVATVAAFALKLKGPFV